MAGVFFADPYDVDFPAFPHRLALWLDCAEVVAMFPHGMAACASGPSGPSGQTSPAPAAPTSPAPTFTEARVPTPFPLLDVTFEDEHGPLGTLEKCDDVDAMFAELESGAHTGTQPIKFASAPPAPARGMSPVPSFVW